MRRSVSALFKYRIENEIPLRYVVPDSDETRPDTAGKGIECSLDDAKNQEKYAVLMCVAPRLIPPGERVTAESHEAKPGRNLAEKQNGISILSKALLRSNDKVDKHNGNKTRTYWDSIVMQKLGSYSTMNHVRSDEEGNGKRADLNQLSTDVYMVRSKQHSGSLSGWSEGHGVRESAGGS